MDGWRDGWMVGGREGGRHRQRERGMHWLKRTHRRGRLAFKHPDAAQHDYFRLGRVIGPSRRLGTGEKFSENPPSVRVRNLLASSG
eukprot:321864-Rhodomonas_salina.3